MNIAVVDTVTTTVRAVLTPYANLIEPEKVDDALAVLFGDKLAVSPDAQTTIEPPMTVQEAAKLLGCSTTAVQYHARKGRIRRVAIPGAKRSRGLVAADVRAILEGRAA